MIINHNIPGLVTNNALNKANLLTDKSSKKLSTGKRINSAADDAAGMAISNKMKTQVKGLAMADRNCNDAISLIQTAEGGLAEVQNMLQRMRELAIQGANDSVTSTDRQKIQDEVDQLIDEIDATASKIQFNTKPLLDGSFGSFTFQVGQNEGLTLSVKMEQITASIIGRENGTVASKGTVLTGMTLSGLRSTAGASSPDGIYTTRDGCARDAITVCDGAIDTVSEFRSRLGAVQNRLEYTISAIGTSSENAETALSRVEDTDMAAEMTNYTKNNVIVQAGISMLAQANQRPNQLLSLLQ